MEQPEREPLAEHEKISELEAIHDNPPKQYVRDQWLAAARERRDRNNADYVNYLTFPGILCLDVELFRQHGLIRMERSVYAPDSLTFCEHDGLRFGLIREKLPNAKDVRLSFEDLVGAGQPGFFNAKLQEKRLFPYDVINLDFERPPFLLRGRPYSRQVASIEKVFELQRGHGRSFALFVTFPAEDNQYDDGGHTILEETIASNLSSGPASFVARYRARYEDDLPAPYYRLLTVVVPKLILRAGTQRDFEVFCTARLTYVGRPRASTQMVSFIFQYEFRGGSTPQQPPLFDALREHYDSQVLGLLDDNVTDVNEVVGV